MRKTFKRSLALVLSLLMLLTVSPMGFAKTAYCKVCQKDVETIEVQEASKPTCKNYGYTIGGESYCPECGYCISNSEGRRLDKLPHNEQNLTKKTLVVPTCEANGNIEHYECESCGKLFLKNGDAFEEVKDADITLYGHTFADVTDADFTFKEKKDKTGFTAKVTLTCTNEGCTASEADLTFDATVDNGTVTAEPKCDRDGNKRYTATLKLNVYVPGEDGEDGEVQVKEFNGKYDFTLTARPEHQYVPHAEVPATCRGVGKKAYYSCQTCKTLFIDGENGEKTVVDDESTLVIKKDPTWGTEHTQKGTVKYSYDETGKAIAFNCEKGGQEFRVCEVCKAEYAPQDIDPTSHVMATHAAVAPTCTTDGTALYRYCKNCEYTDGNPGVVERLGHERGETVPAVTADCSKAGHDAYIKCSRCDYIAIDESVLKWVGPEKDENGNVTKTAEEVLGVYHPQLAHEWTVVSQREQPDCTKSGYAKLVRCKKCDARFMEYDLGDQIPDTAFANVEGLPTYAQSKDDAAIKHYYKAVSSKADAAIPALGHKWVADQSSGSQGYLAPTCENDGYAVVTCPRCLATKTMTLPATEHRLGDKKGETDPTCEDNAMSIYVCSVCNQEIKKDDLYKEGDSSTNQFKAKGHSLKENAEEIQPATCTQPGIMGRKCERDGCSYYVKTSESALAPHTLTKVEGAAATCDKEGRKTYYECSVCHQKFEDQEGNKLIAKDEDLVIVKTGHTDADGDNICDVCNEVVNGCDHICHKTDPFSRIIWFIARLWYQYLGINQYCAAPCGLPHYDSVKDPV